MPEIDESIKVIDETNSNYKYVCNLVRAWKNKKGFKFGGLLIDTLVYNFFDENDNYKDSTFDDYLSLLKDLFYYLKTRNKDQKYWFALGSNQKVYNKGGAFVNQAKKHMKKSMIRQKTAKIYMIHYRTFLEKCFLYLKKFKRVV